MLDVERWKLDVAKRVLDMKTLLKTAVSIAFLTSTASNGLSAMQATDSSDVSENPLPLEGARTIHYDMNEGSWMSLDVSPDGETIVFDYMGDLFVLPIGGGEATQLTSGMAFDAQPRFSRCGHSRSDPGRFLARGGRAPGCFCLIHLWS